MRTTLGTGLAAASLLRRASSSAAIEHPVVDLSAVLRAASSEEASVAAPTGAHAATLDAMRSALTHSGYFYATGCDAVLPERLISSTYDFADRLHALPLEAKRKYARPEGSGETINGVYSGADVGATEPAYEVGTLSLVRSWEYSRTRQPGAGGSDTAGFPEPETRGWGEHGDGGYIATLDHLYAKQDTLARALMLAFAEMFALPRRTFLSHFDSGDLGTIRLLHYPGPPQDSSSSSSSAAAAETVATARADALLDDATLAGISAHTDFEAFTLMHQDAPGLQFLRPPSVAEAASSAPSPREWVDAPVRAGEFVVIVGDMLERFTNGVLKATPHRVLPTPWQRNSIVRFNAFHPQTVVAPLSEFVDGASGGGAAAQYTPVTMETHMATTLKNLEQGLGSWSEEGQHSLSAHRSYPPQD